MTLSWLQIVRLGLVQMCLGAIVVLTTSTLNRLMIVELALPAVLPGALVALQYGIQLSRPKWGFMSDAGGQRTRWIIGGMVALALGGMGAAVSIMLLPTSLGPGADSGDCRLRTDRVGGWGIWNIAVSVTRHRHRTSPPCCRRDNHLADDDFRDRPDRRRGRRTA